MSGKSNVEQNFEKEIIKATQIIEEQVDAEIERLDKLDEDDLESLRHRRLLAMRKQASQQQEYRAAGHGEYTEITDEKEFFNTCNRSKNLVCHFYRDGFFRCSIVDKHLSLLATKHLETKFMKINAEKSPFLTDRLKIRVLPTIVCVRDQKMVDYVVGFEDLGNTDEFSTDMLEWRIARSDVISYSGDKVNPPDEATSAKGKKKGSFNVMRGKKIRGGKDDDDDETDSD